MEWFKNLGRENLEMTGLLATMSVSGVFVQSAKKKNSPPKTALFPDPKSLAMIPVEQPQNPANAGWLCKKLCTCYLESHPELVESHSVLI